MNENTPAPSPVPPQLPASGFTLPAAMLPLGENPEDREKIPNAVSAIESILRKPRRIMYQLRQPGSGRLIFSMVMVAVCCSLIYGVVVGTFSMGDQLWAAPVKIAGGLLFASLICLPSLYIFTCLSGSHARLVEICGLVAGLLALMTVLLIGFAPVAWVFSQSTESLAAMGALHLAFWFIATCFGLRFLSAAFAHYSHSGDGLKVWIVIFLLVMLQMMTALRPIIGTTDKILQQEKKFLVSKWKE